MVSITKIWKIAVNFLSGLLLGVLGLIFVSKNNTPPNTRSVQTQTEAIKTRSRATSPVKLTPSRMNSIEKRLYKYEEVKKEFLAENEWLVEIPL